MLKTADLLEHIVLEARSKLEYVEKDTKKVSQKGESKVSQHVFDQEDKNSNRVYPIGVIREWALISQEIFFGGAFSRRLIQKWGLVQ